MRSFHRFADNFRQDLRLTLRSLRRSPGFVATAVLTLGLGIGATVAMFGVTDRLMFRPLNYLRDPATVQRVYWQWQERGAVATTVSTFYTRYLDLQRGTTSFGQVAAFSELPIAIGEGEHARERRVGVVSASFFDLFDARPVLGRFFDASEDVTPRGADVAVLSFPLWRGAFAGRDVRGERIRVGNIDATIIGVAPDGFDGVYDAVPPEIYVPITTWAASTSSDDATSYFTRYRWSWVGILVRRRAGVTVAQAEADATQAFARSWEAAQSDNPRLPPLATARPSVAISSVRPGAGPNPALEARTSFWLAGVAAIVLVIACANVANLFLARGLRRRRETAIRVALGVSRSRLIAQSLIEGVLVALAGGAAAFVVAQWAAAAIFRVLLPGAPAAGAQFAADWRTLTVTAVATLAAGAIIGLVPAGVPRGDLQRSLRGGARGGTADGRGLRTALLLVQAALSVVLLAGAVLFVRSLVSVQSMRTGYEADRVLLVNRVVRGQVDPKAHTALRELLLAEAKALPAVESAAWVNSAPFVSTSSAELIVPGVGSGDALGSFTYQATTSDYFQTMGTRVLRGRGLSADDRFGAPEVAVVSETMARILWPGQEAIGKCFHMRTETAPCLTVVGVAEDISQRSLIDPVRAHYYLPIVQQTRTTGIGLLVKVRGHAASEAERVRAALQRVIPGASYVTVRPLQDLVREQQRSWRLGARVFVYFGVLALVVAAIGLYGAIGYEVAQRMHELGVRAALGASRGSIVSLVVGRSARIAGAGALIGVAAALAVGRWIQPLLFQQSARDPTVLAGVAGAMVVVALVAAAVPAITASRADPNAALRAE